ncbi:hypothetical protein [Flavobacterium hungaricum]|uniref:Uncharacterized protein n=1 Tax=Flavobacterium hungaricum TaxID=2082725 RepID=A0ABR9TRE8_9FLAO|nr:hypothetical protein [Flavobacterium hungaricum]MBE8727946.1 hypothetical protein [Flavobacterium hungaricum]
MSLSIEAQIYKVLSTSKKLSEDNPDLLFLSFDRLKDHFVFNCYKVFNDEKYPFFSLLVSDKEKLSELISNFLLSEKIRFRFQQTKDPDFMDIESNIRKAFFKDWLFNKVKNVNQRDAVRVKMALEKIK